MYTLPALPERAPVAADGDQPPPPANKVTRGELTTDLQDLTGVRIMWDAYHGQGEPWDWVNMIDDLELRGAEVVVNTVPITAELLAEFDIFWTIDCSSYWVATETAALGAWLRAGGGLLLEGDNSSTVVAYNAILTAASAGIVYTAIFRLRRDHDPDLPSRDHGGRRESVSEQSHRLPVDDRFPGPGSGPGRDECARGGVERGGQRPRHGSERRVFLLWRPGLRGQPPVRQPGFRLAGGGQLAAGRADLWCGAGRHQPGRHGDVRRDGSVWRRVRGAGRGDEQRPDHARGRGAEHRWT